jgi:septum formation protein
MELLGLPFTVSVSGAAEPLPETRLTVRENLKRIVAAKLFPARAGHFEDTVIAADTVVVLGGEYFGKPRDADDAMRMLGLLSGRTHGVYTGVSVARGDYSEFICEKTLIKFRALTRDDISAYIESGRYADKAGAYGIQDSDFVRSLNGDWFNVMGLPLGRVRTALHNAGAYLLR